jgi:ribonuclease BN (tRNA processing enzyme)
MGEVRLIPLGVGDAFSSRHYTTCLALGTGSDWLLLDCPHPIHKMLYEGSIAAGLPVDLAEIRAVVLSHLHADHCSGLEDYAYYSHFSLGRKAILLAHPSVSERLWPNVLAAGMDAAPTEHGPALEPMTRGDFFEVIDLDESRPVTFGPFSVECRATRHSVPTTAFRLTANGRSFGFSADSAYDPALIEWLAPCDLIVHEATTSSTSNVHTPYARLAELPEALRRKMRLIHCPDDFDAEASRIEPLRQGTCLVI